MGLSYRMETKAADWLAQAPAGQMQLISFGPPGFEAYARLRFIPDPDHPGQAEADVELPRDHQPDITQARRALRLLSGFTATPEDCYFCVWEGYPDIEFPPAVRRAALVELPYRRYALLGGSLADLDSWEHSLGVNQFAPPPAFAWPADRSWCFACDVDPHWAGIGARQRAIDALVEDAGLDVVSASPDEAQPGYG